MCLSLSEWRDVASISGVVIALFVYITNTISQFKQRRIDNGMRFYNVHHKLFESKYLRENIKAMEDGSFKRDLTNKEMEKEFNWLLFEIEHIAILQNLKAIPPLINIYMFGWFAQRIQPIIIPEERNNVYWELAVRFLDEMKTAADKFYDKTKEERAKYFKGCGYNA